MPSDYETLSEEFRPCGAGLPPVRGQSTEVIILGNFPGRLSLLDHEYYGNPQNHFWKIVEAFFQIDHHLPYSVRINRLTDQRIALWDVISACSR
jgi:TDG/mug DNA glycosylase family protein